MRYPNFFDFRELFLTLSSEATYCLSELEARMGRRNIKSHSTSQCIFYLCQILSILFVFFGGWLEGHLGNFCIGD